MRGRRRPACGRTRTGSCGPTGRSGGCYARGRRIEDADSELSVWHGVTIDVTVQVEAALAAGLAPTAWATPPLG